MNSVPYVFVAPSVDITMKAREDPCDLRRGVPDIGKGSPISTLLVILVVMKNMGAPGCVCPYRAHSVTIAAMLMDDPLSSSIPGYVCDHHYQTRCNTISHGVPDDTNQNFPREEAQTIPRSTTTMYHDVENDPDVETDISGRRSSPTNISEDRQQCTMIPMQKSVVADALGTAGIKLVEGAALVLGTIPLVESVDRASLEVDAATVPMVVDGVVHLEKIMANPCSWSSNDQLTLSDLLIAAEILEILPKTSMERLP